MNNWSPGLQLKAFVKIFSFIDFYRTPFLLSILVSSKLLPIKLRQNLTFRISASLKKFVLLTARNFTSVILAMLDYGVILR